MQTENGILNKDINQQEETEKSCLGNFVLSSNI